jgi:hypothetical protein
MDDIDINRILAEASAEDVVLLRTMRLLCPSESLRDLWMEKAISKLKKERIHFQWRKPGIEETVDTILHTEFENIGPQKDTEFT